jgi:PhnB protein
MKEVTPYIMFDGNCEQAMKFYQKCLGGTLEMFPYSEAPMPEFQSVKDRIMHGTLKLESASILAADSFPGKPAKQGDNIHISLTCNNMQEAEKIFSSLAEKGKVNMPLQKTFWTSGFGMLTDQFGVHWMINCAH